ncbi:methyltransferase domain-containing protein [Vallitalea maricola]|uniref:Uncharacterized protein n=1 Tax=Vallitalea maricola TaxID=3074433 RepID=A0ACB5UHU5_9FIRM|nr:hypothetical protein AN2V17_17640 [Vallitalea sp. AN17-2]
MKVLQDEIRNLEVDKVLDIGTGAGDFIKILKGGFKKFNHIIGVDSSKKALEMGRENIQDDRIEFRYMSGDRLEFDDSEFDVVSVSNSMHHFKDHSKVFEEVKRVLKPDGMVIVNEMFCDNQSKSQLSHVYLHHYMAEIDTIMGIVHRPTYKKQEIIDLLEDEGLKIIRIFEVKDEVFKNVEEEKKEIEALKKLFDKRLKDIEEHERYDEFVGRAKDIREHLDKYGIAGATQLVIIASK